MTREELIEGLKPLAPTASEVVASDGEDVQVMYLEDVADAIMKAQEKEKTLDVKASIATSVFSVLAAHESIIDKYFLERLQYDTINTTNRIFKGIQ